MEVRAIGADLAAGGHGLDLVVGAVEHRDLGTAPGVVGAAVVRQHGLALVLLDADVEEVVITLPVGRLHPVELALGFVDPGTATGLGVILVAGGSSTRPRRCAGLRRVRRRSRSAGARRRGG